MDPQRFYDDIAADYHWVYADWPDTIECPGEEIDALLAEALGVGPIGSSMSLVGLALRPSGGPPVGTS